MYFPAEDAVNAVLFCVMAERSGLNRQQSMGAGNCQRTVADGESDALRRAGADIPGGQHARDGRLQRTRVAIRARPQSGTTGVGAGQQIALGVAGNLRRQPIRRRFGADENEHGRTAESALLRRP